MALERRFEAVAEALPGSKWQTIFERYWPAYKRWFLSEGVKARPPYLSCLRALRRHLPDMDFFELRARANRHRHEPPVAREGLRMVRECPFGMELQFAA